MADLINYTGALFQLIKTRLPDAERYTVDQFMHHSEEGCALDLMVACIHRYKVHLTYGEQLGLRRAITQTGTESEMLDLFCTLLME